MEDFIEKAPEEKRKDYKKGVCFNILLRSMGSLAHEVQRDNPERAIALARMINLAASGYDELKEGIIDLPS